MGPQQYPRLYEIGVRVSILETEDDLDDINVCSSRRMDSMAIDRRAP
jgi:hypothetical protein